jgi:hypothetical protein
MQTFTFRVFVMSIILFTSKIVLAQNNEFNLNVYKQFLESNQNLTASQLLSLHPAGVFKGDLKINPGDALYFDSLCIKYNLTDYEKTLIEKNGFMVSERLSANTFGHAFFDIFQKDMPVFVSTDAILHAFHRSYDRILRDVEISFLLPNLEVIINNMKNKLPDLAAKYSSSAEMERMLKDVDVYITIPLKLLGDVVDPYYSSNNEVVNELMNLIEAEQPANYSLFSENCRVIDFSQFTPRGHYVDQSRPQLAKYFKAMMWLGRTEIYLTAPRSYPYPCSPQTFNDIQRQIIDALLISELVQSSDSDATYEKIEDILKYFVGDPDNVTLPNLEYMKQAVQIENANQLLDSLKVVEFQDTLKKQSFASQLILSQILYSDPMSPDSIIPASSFLLFGQRFIIDSYVTGSVVYDRIKYNGEKICRLFPSTLDPMFAMGNDAAAQLLHPELETYYYSSNLAALRYLIDSYGNDYWDKTLYNLWLNLIRKLNPPNERTGFPPFMQSAAFWQEKLNTQLASWSQLRHDNLLYAKQSYSGGTLCSYPYVYVEPFPEFFECLNTLASTSLEKFGDLELTPTYLKDNIISYLNDLKNISDTLITVTQKELSSGPLSDKETSFLKKLIYQNEHGSGIPPYGGWYAKLFYDDPEGYDGLLKEDFIVADIHTVPTDCGGGSLGAVVHVGTGLLNLGVFLAEVPGTGTVTFIGPLLSYSEYNTTNFKRLTDQEWQDTYYLSSLRPSWVNIYLADKSGNSKGEGLQLMTSVEKDDNNNQIPKTMLLAQNYPNPFNMNTIIRFSIPAKLSNQNAKLNVYDINGQLVKQLLNENLPAGNYLTRWDGSNNNGTTVTSGIYFYNLNVGGNQISGKMSLIK